MTDDGSDLSAQLEHARQFAQLARVRSGMRIYKNDQRVRRVAGHAAGISPERVSVEEQDGCVIVSLPTTMLLSSDQRRHVKREIEGMFPGIRVALV